MITFIVTTELVHVVRPSTPSKRGLRAHGLSPHTSAHLWSSAIRPVLTYGAHCVHLSSAAIAEMQRTQGALMKQALGLYKSCHHTKLLQALNLEEIGTLIQKARVRTLRSALQYESRACDFYSYVFSVHCSGGKIDTRGAIAHAAQTASAKNVTLTSLLLGQSAWPTTEPQKDGVDDGFNDTLCQLLCFYSDSSRELLQSVLKSF